jgi:hypothetical protein
MIIYNWLTEETAPILLDFIDNKLSVKSRFGGINNGEMKLISFTKDGCVYTIVIDETGIKYASDLTGLEGIEEFVLQEIRNQKLEDLGV